MVWNDLPEDWKAYFIRELHLAAGMSKDADTQVGAIIVDIESREVLIKGWNDLPRGVKHTPERNNRPLKYMYTTHAEQNAFYNAMRNGVKVKGMTMLSTLYSCNNCAMGVIQGGIKEFVCPTPDWNYPSLKDVFPVTKAMFNESYIITTFDDALTYRGGSMR